MVYHAYTTTNNFSLLILYVLKGRNALVCNVLFLIVVLISLNFQLSFFYKIKNSIYGSFFPKVSCIFFYILLIK